MSLLSKKEYLIRNLKNDVPINQALEYCFVLVGFDSNKISSIERATLIDFIKGCYQGYVAEEIKIAFKMAVARKITPLTEDHDKWIAHYQQFSCEYFGRIISAYDKYRRGILSANSQVAKPEPPQKNIEPNEFWEGVLFAPYDEFCKTGIYTFQDFLAVKIFDWLVELKFNLVGNVDEAKKTLREIRLATPKLKRQRMTDAQESEKDYNYRVNNIAKAMTLKEKLTKHRELKTDLRSIVLSRLNSK